MFLVKLEKCSWILIRDSMPLFHTEHIIHYSSPYQPNLLVEGGTPEAAAACHEA